MRNKEKKNIRKAAGRDTNQTDHNIIDLATLKLHLCEIKPMPHKNLWENIETGFSIYASV